MFQCLGIALIFRDFLQNIHVVKVPNLFEILEFESHSECRKIQFGGSHFEEDDGSKLDSLSTPGIHGKIQ